MNIDWSYCLADNQYIETLHVIYVSPTTYARLAQELTTKETTMGDEAQQEPTKPETGQRWRWTKPGIGQQCLAKWWQVGDVALNGNVKISKCADGCTTHSSFGEVTFKRGEQEFVGWEPGYGPQPSESRCPHIRQEIFGSQMPCAHPTCEEGFKGAVLTLMSPGGYRLQFDRRASVTIDNYHFYACPQIEEAGAPAQLLAHLRAYGFASAIIENKPQPKKATKRPEREKADALRSQFYGDLSASANIQAAMQARQSGKSLAIAGRASAQAMRAQEQLWAQQALSNERSMREAIEAMEKAMETKPYFGVDRTVGTPFVPNYIGDDWGTDVSKAIQEAHNAIVAATAKQAVPRIGVKKPQKREVSHNGRTWIDYDRMEDPDAFDVYPHRRVDGVEVPMMATPAAMRVKVIGSYYGVMRAHEASPFAKDPKSEYIRLPKPRPWAPSCDDFDLLPDVG